MNKYGIHISNKGHRDLDQMLQMGVSWYTGLHINHQELWRVRYAQPDANIVVRFYLPNWSRKDPVEWANVCADWANSQQHLTNHFTPANEMNLESEGGGASFGWYDRINKWLLRWEQTFRARVPNAILHWPALAFGHQEDGRLPDGTDLPWTGYGICAESLEAYDIIDYHPYWRFNGRGLWDGTERWFAFRFVPDRERFFPDKPVFISECGNWAHQSPETIAEMLHFFNRLYEWDWVLGATPFIWDSGPEHGANIWVGNNCLIGGITHVYKPDVGTPEPEPVPRYVDLVGQLPTDGEYVDRDLSEISMGIIHHTVSYLDDEREYIDRVARYHIRRGWPGIGYHYCIGRDGTAYRTNPLWKVSYHSGPDGNPSGVGIAFLGNYDDQKWAGVSPMRPTRVQLQSARNILGGIRRIIPGNLEVVGHRDVRATRCPGENLYRLIGDGLQ